MIKNNITKRAARNRVALFLLDIASCFGNVIELALSLGSIKIERGGHGKKKKQPKTAVVCGVSVIYCLCTIPGTHVGLGELLLDFYNYCLHSCSNSGADFKPMYKRK